MKRIFLTLLMVLTLCIMFAACATISTNQTACTIYEDVGATAENSVIAKLISDPCVAQKILGTAAKAPVIWSDNYVEEFNKWADKIQAVLESGVTYQDLQNLVVLKIAEINKEVGLALILVSDSIFVFNGETQVINEVDQKLLLMSLADLKAQVNKMAVLAGAG